MSTQENWFESEISTKTFSVVPVKAAIIVSVSHGFNFIFLAWEFLCDRGKAIYYLLINLKTQSV